MISHRISHHLTNQQIRQKEKFSFCPFCVRILNSECASNFCSAANEQIREIVEDLIDDIKVGKGVGSKYDTEIHLSGTYKEFFSI